MMAKSYNIEINNWDKYQPRKDLKSLSWVRIQSDIFFSETFFELDNNQKLLFFYLMTFAGKKNTNALNLNIEFISSNLKLKSVEIESGLKKLESLSILHIVVSDSSRIRTDVCSTIRNDTIRYDTIRYVTNTVEPTQAAKAVDVVVFKISSTKSIDIKKELVSSWSDTYPKEFLTESLKEMRNWILSNPEKSPKSAWAKFMNGWFKRGWEQYRKNIKSNPTKLTVEDLNESLGSL